jgi:hypothetical protein
LVKQPRYSWQHEWYVYYELKQIAILKTFVLPEDNTSVCYSSGVDVRGLNDGGVCGDGEYEQTSDVDEGVRGES